MNYTIAGFFAGVGGIEYGFEQTGHFKTVWANEIDKACEETYKLNFENEIVIDDIKNIDSEDVPQTDIIVAGFPCQAFSIAGYRKGFKDDRGNVFFELDRIISEKLPRVVFLENVKNLISHDKGNTYRVIEQALKTHGYKIWKEVLNAKDYGNIPQNRERIYIVAFRNKQDYANFEPIISIPLEKQIKDMLDKKVDSKYIYTEDSTVIYPKIVNEINQENTAYQWRRKYVRKNQSNVFPTLTANMGLGGHNVPLVFQNNKIRKLTPRECFRVQGFDENYKLPSNLSDTNLYKQAGNSVVVPVIRRLAKSIADALIRTDESTNLNGD